MNIILAPPRPYYLLTLLTLSAAGSISCGARTDLPFSNDATGGDTDAGAATEACDNGLTNGSGCCDGTREGFLDMVQFPDIAACGGAWKGHVSNASLLCESGWHVCSPPVNATDMAIVEAITFDQATGFPGCFAYAAAHDFNTCIPCTGLENHDDMAGMGDACTLNEVNVTGSCTAAGRVDADCCDGELGCAFSPTLAGAICCRDPVHPSPAPPPRETAE